MGYRPGLIVVSDTASCLYRIPALKTAAFCDLEDALSSLGLAFFICIFIPGIHRRLIEKRLRWQGLNNTIAIKEDTFKLFSMTIDFFSVTFLATTAPLASVEENISLGEGHDTIAHLLATIELALELVAVAVSNLDLAMQTAAFPHAFIHGSVKEVILSITMLPTIAEAAIVDVIVRIRHDTRAGALVVPPLALVFVPVRPEECSNALSWAIFGEYSLEERMTIRGNVTENKNKRTHPLGTVQSLPAKI